MDAERQKEIARKGGRAAHEKGKAHEFTPDEARQDTAFGARLFPSDSKFVFSAISGNPD